MIRTMPACRRKYPMRASNPPAEDCLAYIAGSETSKANEPRKSNRAALGEKIWPATGVVEIITSANPRRAPTIMSTTAHTRDPISDMTFPLYGGPTTFGVVATAFSGTRSTHASDPPAGPDRTYGPARPDASRHNL